VDGKIFICSEPTTLICLDAKNGNILWQRNNHYFDTLTEDKAKKAKKLLEQSQEMQKELKDLEEQLDELKKKLTSDPNNREFVSKIESQSSKISDLKTDIEKLSAYKLPKTHAVNGYSSPTPTVDSQYVYVLFGNGVAACYDFEGNRKWIKFIEEPQNDWGHSSSPLLIGNRLIIHFINLRALDTCTGRELWKVETSARWGSPIKGKIDDVDVVITAGGDIVKTSNGQILGKEISFLDYSSPILSGSNIYFIESDSVAFKLPSKISEEIKFEEIWKTKLKKDRYYASSVLHENLIYAITRNNVLSVLDASNGTLIYEKKLELGKGTVYPSIVLAGNNLLISSDNGTTIVLKAGNEYVELAKNKIEGFRSCPLVVDNKMYIRSFNNLYCISKN
jgi:outer membrane protein assembly factor BamB